MRAQREVGDEDRGAGFTLVELMVVMLVFGIIVGIVGDAIARGADFVVQQQNTDQSASQVENAFLTLDTEVRYAADITSTPYAVNGNPVVELESDWTTATLGSPRCTEVEYLTGQGVLQQRVWQMGSTVPTTWQVLTTGLATTPPTAPFSLSAAGWQLTLALTSSTGVGIDASAAQSNFTMTALDTTSSSTTNPSQVCGGVPQT